MSDVAADLAREGLVGMSRMNFACKPRTETEGYSTWNMITM
jgi:hypothetical protein